MFFKFSFLYLHRIYCIKGMTQRELIIEQAARMFVNQGVKAVRMDDIARELGVSKRTIYEQFGDKEELLYLCIKHFIEQGHARRQAQIADIDNDLEVMLFSFRDMISVAPITARMRRNIKRFYPSVFQRIEEDAQKKSRDDLRRWLGKCVENGYMMPTSNCDFVVKVLYESVQGILVSENMENENMINVISMISYSLVIFIRGLCTPEGITIIDRCFDKYFSNIPAPNSL